MSRSRLAMAVRFGVVLVLLLLPRTGFTQQQLQWVPTDLGTLGGTSSAADINASGQIVGTSATASGTDHAFIWTRAGGMVDLGTLGGPTSSAVAINDAGQVIGQSQVASREYHAFVWTASDGMTDLGQMVVSDINNAGQIVGTFNDHAVLQMTSGAMVDLGTLGGSWSRAAAINDVGQVVGTSGIPASFNVHAFLWTAAGGMVGLPAPGETPNGPRVEVGAEGINNAGQVAGTYMIAPVFGIYDAFSWTATGGMVLLGPLGLGTASEGHDVNNAGQVVGLFQCCARIAGHAFIWTAAAGIVRVDTLGGFDSSTATAINDTGQIVGSAEVLQSPRRTRAILWEFRYPEPLSVTMLSSSATGPVTAGTPVTWTAAATGGAQPYTFQYWIFDGATWTMARDWDLSPSWTWESPRPGTYTVQVWVRNAGSSTEYDAWLGASATISMPSVLTLTTVTSSVPSVPAGTTVTWTATVAGPGTAPYTYKFFVFDGTTWRIGQDWSPANAWTWTPAIPGTYLFQVWVRNAGSAAEYDAWRQFGPYTATRPSFLTVTRLEKDVASIPAGTPVTWTATAAGGSWPYWYRFLLYDGTTWSIGQDWNLTNTWTWLPTTGGTYTVQVWAKRFESSSADYDDWAQSVAIVAEPSELHASLTSPLKSPVPAGTPVTWTARGVGGTGPYAFKFWLFNGSTWSVGQDWSTSSKWAWVPTSPGTYGVQVWIRNAGSSAAYDGWSSTPPLAISSATPLEVVTLTTAPMSPLFSREGATVSATAVGGIGPYTYEFWIYDGSTWTVGQTWSPSSTYAWRPTASGTYWIQAWVRNAGSTSPYDAWSGLGPLTVLP